MANVYDQFTGGNIYDQFDRVPSLPVQEIPTQTLGERVRGAIEAPSPAWLQAPEQATREFVQGIPGMIGQMPRMSLEGYKLAAGTPEQRSATIAKALAEAEAMGQQNVADLQSEPGSVPWYRGLINTGMMALPAAQELIPGLRGAPEVPDVEAPPVQQPPSAPIPDPWVSPGAQIPPPDPWSSGAPLADAIQQAQQAQVAQALNPLQPESPVAPPQFFQPTPTGPAYDPVAAAQFQQQAMAEAQPLLAAEYQFKKNGQPVPDNLKAAIKANEEKRQTGYQPSPPPPVMPQPASGVSIPVMITRKMEADLRARGLDQAAINKLTPQQAHEILTQPGEPYASTITSPTTPYGYSGTQPFGPVPAQPGGIAYDPSAAARLRGYAPEGVAPVREGPIWPPEGAQAIPPADYGYAGIESPPGPAEPGPYVTPPTGGPTGAPPSPLQPGELGISRARTEAELGPGSVVPGAGAEMGSGLEYGRNYINKGGDPRLPIRRAQTSGMVGRNDVGIVHAELDRLRVQRNIAARQLEANPDSPQLKQDFADADNAQRAWRKELQPVLTKASDALREAYAASTPSADPGTYQGLADLFDEHFKGTREISEQMRTQMAKAARGVSESRGIANAEMKKVEDNLTKQLKGKKVMTPAQLDADLKGVLADFFKDCV